jgi:hypothetical protein
MQKFVTDDVKIRSDFIGSIDSDYLNKKVQHASLRIFWLHLLTQTKHCADQMLEQV